MRIAMRAASLVAFLITTGCHQETPIPPAVPTQVEASKPQPIEADPDTKKRKALAKEWLATAELVARKTGDPEAKKLVRFLVEHSILCKPAPVGAMVLERCEQPPGFFFVPLIKGDEATSQDWFRMATDKNFAANYLTDPGILIVRATPVSKLWRGIILLHETRHAFRATNEPGEQDEKAYCEEERDTHDFENRLATKLGGKAYLQVVEKEVARQRRLLAKRKGEVGASFEARSSDLPVLNRIFGPSKSAFETKMRATHVWIHALFRWIDEDYHGDRANQKALVLRAIYQQHGVLDRR